MSQLALAHIHMNATAEVTHQGAHKSTCTWGPQWQIACASASLSPLVGGKSADSCRYIGHMAAATAWPGAAASNSLLLSRSPPHAAAAALALAPSPGSSMRRRLILGVGTPAVAALAAAAPPAVLQDGAVTVLITAGAYSLVRVFDELTERRLIEKVETFAH